MGWYFLQPDGLLISHCTAASFQQVASMICMHDVLILPGDIEGDSSLAEEICESLIHSIFPCSCH